MIMGFLEGAATSFAVNMFSNLVWDKKIAEEDKKVRKEIQEIIKNFNRKYDDTELDTLAFQTVLEIDEVKDELYERIFKGYKKDSSSLSEFKKIVSQKAIFRVNEYYQAQGRSPIKNKFTFEEYFSNLIDILVEIRENLLSTSESAQVSILNEKINDSTDVFKQEIGIVYRQLEAMQEDNIFAEERIETIQKAIDLYKLEEAASLIERTLEFQTSLSKNQREVIYYQRARLHIINYNNAKLEEIKKIICRINKESKYLTEIDFYIACQTKNHRLLETALQSFESKKYSAERILLKKQYFDICNQKYEKVFEILYEDGGIKKDLKEFPETYGYLGIIFSSKGEPLKAEEFFNSAYNLSNSIIHKYNATLSKGSFLFNIYIEKIGFGEYPIDEYREIIGQLKEFTYITNNLSNESKENHWLLYINLNLTFDIKLALREIENIPTALNGNPLIESLKADVFLKNEKYSEAKDKLLNQWSESLVNIYNLFAVLSIQEDWDELINRYKKITDPIFKDSPIIKLMYFNAKIKVKGIDETKEEIEKIISDYPNEISLYPIILKIGLEFNSSFLIDEIYKGVLENTSHINDYLLGMLSNLFFQNGHKDKTRKILESRVVNNENLLLLFIETFKQSHKDEELVFFRKKLKAFYEQGCKFKSLFENIIELDFDFQDFKSNFFSYLEEYKNLFGVDEFYSRYFIAANIFINRIESFETELSSLRKAAVPQDLQLISRLRAHQNSFEEAERIAIEALYLLRNSLDVDILRNHVSLYFSHLVYRKKEANFNKPQVDTVTIMRSEKGIRKVAIHIDDLTWKKAGEKIFGCENYNQNEHISLILSSLGQVGEKIDVDREVYEILEVLSLGTYLFRYCLDELNNNYSDSSFMKVLSSNDPEDFKAQLQESLKENKEKFEKQLALYNFSENDIGIPISSISGKNLQRYSEVLIGIFNMPSQPYYAGNGSLHRREKYVLSINSLILLTHLNYLSNLEAIAEKFVFIGNVENQVKSVIKELSNLTENKVGSLNLTDDNQMYGHMHSNDELLRQKKFWIDLLRFLSKIEKIHVKVEHTDLHEIMAGIVLDEEFSAIELSKNGGYCLILDDQFLSRVASVMSENIQTNNIVGLLVSENILSEEELELLFSSLHEKQYQFAFNISN